MFTRLIKIEKLDEDLEKMWDGRKKYNEESYIRYRYYPP